MIVLDSFNVAFHQVDWMIEVQINYNLSQETLYLAVDILSRYIRYEWVSRNDLQLVGAASMLIASKYEEIYPPEVGEFVYICASTYTRQNLLAYGWNSTRT